MMPCVVALALLCLFAEGIDATALSGFHGRRVTQLDAPGPEMSSEYEQETIPLSCDFAGPFPYMASLRDSQGDYRCGAVLIRSHTVITAASCVQDPNGNPIGLSEVFLGGFERETPIERRTVTKVVVHPNYNGNPEDGSDLALVKFSNTTCLSPVPFMDRQTAPGEAYHILGFGRLGATEPLAVELQVANVTNLGYQVCNSARRISPPLRNTQLCSETEKCMCASVCEGDEGGPVLLIETLLEFNDTLIGIMSYSNGPCDDEGTLGVHTAVQPFLEWIYRTLQLQDY